MAEHTFDYAHIGEIYKSMTEITGDAGSPDSIAGILELANKEMEAKCGVEEEAIFGPLANQLTLNWQNFSSNFPNFVANFNNWSTAVASASQDYTDFEDRAKTAVQEMRDSNPLGYASAGATSNFIENSYYQQYNDEHLEQWVVDAANLGNLYVLTAADYTDTGMVAKYQAHVGRVNTAEGFAIAAGATALASWGAHAIIGSGAAGGGSIAGLWSKASEGLGSTWSAIKGAGTTVGGKVSAFWAGLKGGTVATAIKGGATKVGAWLAGGEGAWMVKEGGKWALTELGKTGLRKGFFISAVAYLLSKIGGNVLGAGNK